MIMKFWQLWESLLPGGGIGGEVYRLRLHLVFLVDYDLNYTESLLITPHFAGSRPTETNHAYTIIHCVTTKTGTGHC